MKIKKIFSVIVLIAIFFVGLLYLSTKNRIANDVPEIIQNESSQATIAISFSDDETLSENIEPDENSTAFSLLKTVTENNSLPLETEQYDFGVFVKSIDGLEGSSERAWIYFINGESGSVSADQATVTGGDLVEWKLISPNE